MRNSIILVDFIEQRIAEGMPLAEAVVDAGAVRFRPMLLTALAVVAAAKQRDPAATLKAVSATLQTCVGCHATYRQEIVDEAAWEKLTKRP